MGPACACVSGTCIPGHGQCCASGSMRSKMTHQKIRNFMFWTTRCSLFWVLKASHESPQIKSIAIFLQNLVFKKCKNFLVLYPNLDPDPHWNQCGSTTLGLEDSRLHKQGAPQQSSYFFLLDNGRIRIRTYPIRTDPDPGGPKTIRIRTYNTGFQATFPPGFHLPPSSPLASVGSLLYESGLTVSLGGWALCPIVSGYGGVHSLLGVASGSFHKWIYVV